MTWRRSNLLPVLVLKDALRSPITSEPAANPQTRERRIDDGIRWLCLTHDVTARRGSSKGFSLVFGWAPPFPETTGYIIGTLLAYGRRSGSKEVERRAREMGDWEIEVQNPDGGVIEGLLTGERRPSTVFNTGMVIHGWLDLHESAPNDDYVAAALRGGHFLTHHQDDDGAWRGAVEYFRIPHTYSARVSWALLRLAQVTGDSSFEEAARRQLNWVLSMQGENGWFDACFFKPGMKPNTHSIAYTLRGLLESFALTHDERYLAATRKTSDVLIGKLEELRWLPASFDSKWRPAARYECLTGTAQLGGVWLRLHQVTGEDRFLRAGLTTVERVVSHQSRVEFEPIRGALPGSYPIYGRYAPLQFPNWATKFLVDALLLSEECVRNAP